MLYDPLIINIPEDWNIQRDIRNPKDWYKEFTYGKKFDEIYDYTTLFCGAFKFANKVVLIGPPLLNIKKFIELNVEITDGKNKLEFNSSELDRCEISIIDLVEDVDFLQFFYNGNLSVVIPLETRSEKYDDKKIVFTMQKDETIDSIKTYISYYRDLFNIDGFVIFDNNSQSYTLEELDSCLKDIGVDYEIINWPLRHGPIGPPWDSEFGRICAFQYLKYKFGFNCKCVVNLDIDEMLICDNSLDEVIESMIDQKIDTISIQSKNISRYTLTSDKDFQIDTIKNYYYYHPNDNEIDGERSSMIKWITLPKYSHNYCWTTHSVMSPHSTYAEQIYYAHMWIFCSPNHMIKNAGTSVMDARFTIHDGGYIEDVKLKENLSKIANV
jgi:hypothetical protein